MLFVRWSVKADMEGSVGECPTRSSGLSMSGFKLNVNVKTLFRPGMMGPVPKTCLKYAKILASPGELPTPKIHHGTPTVHSTTQCSA